MMTSIATIEKKTPGRPKRVQGETLVRLTLNVSPKHKLALELLSRCQSRSLTTTLEWAIEFAANSYTALGTDETIGAIVNRAWNTRTHSGRIREIYRVAPCATTFDDAAACDLIERSIESKSDNDETTCAFNQLVDNHWERIHAHAVELSNQGKTLCGHSIAAIISASDQTP